MQPVVRSAYAQFHNGAVSIQDTVCDGEPVYRGEHAAAAESERIRAAPKHNDDRNARVDRPVSGAVARLPYDDRSRC